MKATIILIAERREDHGVKFDRDSETDDGNGCYQHALLESNTDAKSKTPNIAFPTKAGLVSIFDTVSWSGHWQGQIGVGLGETYACKSLSLE